MENSNTARETLSDYTTKQRIVETISLIAFTTLLIWNLLSIKYVPEKVWVYVLLTICAMASADFVSGFVHWAADTWGNTSWPIVGKSLIRSFREHHVDPKAITKHDFTETNGASSMVTLPILGAAALLPLANDWQLFVKFYVSSFSFWILFTNQIHKWSHQDQSPKFASVLQKFRIILTKKVHNQHHAYPFTLSYCITTGWLNPVLNKIRFFRILEWTITKLTGAIAREDDKKLFEIIHVKK